MKHSAKVLFAAAILVLGAAYHAGARPPIKWIPISHSELCVTDGTIDENAKHELTVDVTKMRAIVRKPTEEDIEAHFTYSGGSKTETALGSGAMRRQFGFKLRAQDPCNLVYAMWRIEPKEELVVSVKSNPGQHTSSECGNHGYTDIKPSHSAKTPAIPKGSTHNLRAEMNGTNLHVYADDTLVWEGNVGPVAAKFVGPVGIRSDNVKLEFELHAGELTGNHTDHELGCKADPDESD